MVELSQKPGTPVWIAIRSANRSAASCRRLALRPVEAGERIERRVAAELNVARPRSVKPCANSKHCG